MLRLIALLASFGFALVGSRAVRFSSASPEGGGGESNWHSISRPEYLPNSFRLFDSHNVHGPSANGSILARDASKSAHQHSLTTVTTREGTRRPSGPKIPGSHPHHLRPSKGTQKNQRTSRTVVGQDDYYDGDVRIPEDGMRGLEPLADSHQQPLDGEAVVVAGGFNPDATTPLLLHERKDGGRNEGLDRVPSSVQSRKGSSSPEGEWDRGKAQEVEGEGRPNGAKKDNSEPILEPDLLLHQPAGGSHQSSDQKRSLEVPLRESNGASSCTDGVDDGPSKPSLPGIVPLQGAATVITSRRVESNSSSLLEDGSVVSVLPRPLTLAKSTCPDILKWAPPVVEPAVIVQVVSEDFIAVEENFIILMEKNSGVTRENILLICLDPVTVRTFTELGVRCAPVIGIKSHTMIYTMRVKVLGCLLEAGRNVLLSDSDALWLKDPFEDMYQHGIVRDDIVTQRGSYPVDLGHLWGVTMCMGFAFFRGGTEGMMEFQRVFMKSLLETGDDQVGVNHAAAELGMFWDRHPKQSDMRYFHSTSIASGVVKQLPGNFSVVLLPHRRYIRECHRTKVSAETVVAHCLTTKKAGDKLSWMKTMNLWLVDVEPLSSLVPGESTP